MRPSPLRHNLARLRLFLGLGQKQMAEVLKCSASAIQSIELGHLKLSESLAKRAAFATGVHPGWLLENDTTAPILSKWTMPYEKYDYFRAQSDMVAPVGQLAGDSWREENIVGSLLTYYCRMRSIFASAGEKREEGLAFFELALFLESLRERYGWKKEVFADENLRHPGYGPRTLALAKRDVESFAKDNEFFFDENGMYPTGPDGVPMKPAKAARRSKAKKV